MKTPERTKSGRKPRQKVTAAGLSADDDVDVRIGALANRLAPLLSQLQAAQEQARRLGLFPNDRDLLTCPDCGLTEDVLAGGHLITNVRPGQPDTELRFIEPTADDGPFVCPACGAEARAQEA